MEVSRSGIIRVDAFTRRMHLAGLLPVTRPARDAFTPLESRVFYIAGGHLALKHFNERSNDVIPDLSERLQGCDIQLTIEYRDTQYSRIVGAGHLSDILQKWPRNTLEDPFPSAIVGAGRSDVSETISTLGSMFQLPVVSPHSSAASLDDKVQYPYFARTTPSNAADGRAAVDYFFHLQVSHMGLIYVLDTNGIAYHEAIQTVSRERGMTTVSIPYQYDAGEDAMRQALKRLKASGVRYIFAVIEPATWKQFIRIAVEEQIIGQPEYVWVFHSGMVGLVPEELDKDTEYDIARAIHGSGVLLKDFPSNEKVDVELVKLETDLELQQEFVSKWSEPEVFDGFDFRYPGPNYPQYINYDAIIALGLAACAVNVDNTDDFFSGDDLYKSLLQIEFQGASDYVSFDNVTGTRNSVPFQVDNIMMVEKESNSSILGFVQDPVAKVTKQGVLPIKDFVYWDNTTVVPLTLPAQGEDLALIPTGLRAVGLSLCALSMLMSVGWSIWTWYYRNSDVVKSSQPFFLVQLCLGTLLMASSIIPMSLQEPISERGLDIACMSTLWLLFSGYAIAFAALFSKSWRINRLIKYGKQCRRVTISTTDAMFPLAILMVCNVSLLTVWTVMSPVAWNMIEVANYDEFGRSVESYGRCDGDGSVTTTIIISLMALVNGLGLLFTNYQGLKTRSLPTEFNESFFLAIANGSLLEALILGIPILVLANGSPSTSFIVKAMLVTLVCLCVLLPMFIPKHLQRKIQAKKMISRKQSAIRESLRTSGNGSNFFQEIQEIPEECLGTRVTRHDGYYLQRKVSKPPSAAANLRSRIFSMEISADQARP
jgi:hypothetical protein